MRDLLKFITCGSVDDGKSTLIGHLLYDSKLVYADQEQALLLESRVGSRGGQIDYSLLLDGLEAEREQGITIDVAYRYFTTDARSFIVADTPGHEEYTRNMAVGASFADLAVILVDASKGVQLQTRRHLRICAMMGIRDFVFAVNKMDLVDYSAERFAELKAELADLAEAFSPATALAIPVSATEGDGILRASERMPFYDGPALLEHLERVEPAKDAPECGFALPVQRVSRPDSGFRGFQGTVASGMLAVGNVLRTVPGTTVSRVSGILRSGEDVQSVTAGDAVTVALEDEIDVSRGTVLAAADDVRCGSVMTVQVLWFDDADLMPGKNYLFKLATRAVTGTVLNVKYRIDPDTGEHVVASQVGKNGIAVCDISLSEHIAYRNFADDHTLGSMILIDRVTNATSGCATVLHPLDRSENVTYHQMDVTRALREAQLGQKALTIWFTGLSGSGKSTIANALEQRLHAAGCRTMLLDGDNVRLGLNKNLGFTERDRIENIRRIAEVSKLMNDAGLVVLVSFISPYRRDRQSAREIVGEESFFEAHVSTPLSVCEQRDVKGLYAKARRNEIRNFTGVSSPYEEPLSPDIKLDTSLEPLEESIGRLLDALLPRIRCER